MKTKTNSQKFDCLECKNQVTVEPTTKVMDMCECQYCGIEYEVKAIENNEFELEICEEEK
jgi:transcription elongation factor Elf1